MTNTARFIRNSLATVATVAIASFAPTATPAAPKYPQYFIVHVSSQTKTVDTYGGSVVNGGETTNQNGSETIQSSYSQDMSMEIDNSMYGVTLGKTEGPAGSNATVEGSSSMITTEANGGSLEMDQAWMGNATRIAGGTQPSAAAGILDDFGSTASGFSARFNVAVPATCTSKTIVAGSTTTGNCDKGIIYQQFDVTSKGHDPSPYLYNGAEVPLIGEAHGDPFNGYTLRYGGTLTAVVAGVKHQLVVNASMTIHIVSKLKGPPK